MPIDLKDLFDKSKIEQARTKHTPPEYHVVRLLGGPKELDHQIRRLESTPKTLVFTGDFGAVEYIRRKSNAAYTEYVHLTAELKEQLAFEEELLKLSGLLENPDLRMRWIATFRYDKQLSTILKRNGFRWDPVAKEWFAIGSRNGLSEELNEIENLCGVKLTCEMIE
jgi:hypothetical protein